jgi:hypothetical protein
MATELYIFAGKSITVDSLTDIVQHMSNEKGFADVDEKTNTDKRRKADEQAKGNATKRIRVGGHANKKKNGNSNNNKGKPNPNDPCP